jgi:hypothetical protein
MRRYLGAFLGTLLLFGCSDMTESPVETDTGTLGIPAVSTASEVFDGSSDGNPHFFFLSPLVEGPVYSGVADISLKPVVTVCNITGQDPAWNPADGLCSDILVEFSMDAADPNDQLSVGDESYSVVWKTDRYPAPEGETFRIAVSILDRTLGWLDATSYPPSVFASFTGTDPEGNVAISSNGSANIKFRIEDGALEAAYCDATGIQDCDVLVLDPDEDGTLRVFDEDLGGFLGSEVKIPAGAKLNGAPLEKAYAVILKLQENNNPQPGPIPNEQQVPYFIDLRTDPPGVGFDRSGEGVRIVLCQPLEGQDAIDEELHPFLKVFLTRTGGAGGPSTRILDTAFGADECEEFEPHYHTTARDGIGGQEGMLSRFTAGLSRVAGYFLPRPLMARRLHGGLNTVVWEISGEDEFDDGDGGAAAVSGLSFSLASSEEEVLHFGSVLFVDPEESSASVFITEPAVVESETEILVRILNAAGDPFPLKVDVSMEVSGANTRSLTAISCDGSPSYCPTPADYPSGGILPGTFRAVYTPTVAGTDEIVISASIEGYADAVVIGTFYSEVHPLSGDLVVVVEIEGGAPADGLPVYLYQGSGPHPFGTSTTGPDGAATFVDIEFGDYTVHLPKRDFDVEFATMTQTVSHQSAPSTVTFNGATQALPVGVQVYRIKDEGNGHAFRYVLDGQSWVSSEKKAQGLVVLDVAAHLATITSAGENAFVTERVKEGCGADLSKCKSQAWIGLSFNSTAGAWAWVTGETFDDDNWGDGFPSTRNNHDHAEMNPFGFWSNTNGARSTNDGYVAEWPASQPLTPPPSLGGTE